MSQQRGLSKSHIDHGTSKLTKATAPALGSARHTGIHPHRAVATVHRRENWIGKTLPPQDPAPESCAAKRACHPALPTCTRHTIEMNSDLRDALNAAKLKPGELREALNLAQGHTVNTDTANAGHDDRPEDLDGHSA